MIEKKPLLSVIIPHLNQPNELGHCLRSLDSQVLDRSLFEVIVVDNGSTSLPEVVVRRHAGTKLIQELTPGPGIARNRGVHQALGDILAFIDADCRAHPNWLAIAVTVLNSTQAGIVLGGDVQIWRDKAGNFSALEAYESVFAYRFKLYIQHYGFSGTGNLVVRRCDFDRVGPFRAIEVAEDMDWGERAHASGCTFQFVPEMIVYHPARKSFGELCVKWDRHIQHALNTTRGTSMWRLRWIIRAFAVLVSPLLDWNKVVTSDRIHGLPAYFKAIFIMTAIRTYRTWKMLSLLRSSRGVVWNRSTGLGQVDK
jgi:glycosyltransferase involved in cell wall biosynthesis